MTHKPDTEVYDKVAIITHRNATAGFIEIVRKSAVTGRCPPPVQFSRTNTKICRSCRTSRVPLLMMAVRWLVSGRGADGCGSSSPEEQVSSDPRWSGT